MADGDEVFSGSIPEVYDTYLVPLIFEEFARDLAQRTVALSPNSILETAAGTGVVARALAPRLTSGARYVVTDLNWPMLDHAANRQEMDDRIAWQQADALNLPVEDAAFDAVCCQFGVMFFPDRLAGYAEARRVLRPGGSFLFNVWDRIEANEFAHVVTDTAAAVFPDNPPRFLARTPHGYHDTALIREELGNAGFSGFPSQRLRRPAVRPRPATRPSPTAKERHYVMRSRRAMPVCWAGSQIGQPRQFPNAMATARYQERSKGT